ncbi:MAG: hypothetical protein LBF27_25615 [Sphingobacterium sp.]|jgi:hypothetical protein|nr:hypothetical protein [Sphingobacterium sp.]
MTQIDRSEYLNNKLDKDTPYKITAPKYSLVPVRLSSKEYALKLFNELTQQGMAAVLTYNSPLNNSYSILKTGPQTIYSLSEE